MVTGPKCLDPWTQLVQQVQHSPLPQEPQPLWPGWNNRGEHEQNWTDEQVKFVS